MRAGQREPARWLGCCRRMPEVRKLESLPVERLVSWISITRATKRILFSSSYKTFSNRKRSISFKRSSSASTSGQRSDNNRCLTRFWAKDVQRQSLSDRCSRTAGSARSGRPIRWAQESTKPTLAAWPRLAPLVARGSKLCMHHSPTNQRFIVRTGCLGCRPETARLPLGVPAQFRPKTDRF